MKIFVIDVKLKTESEIYCKVEFSGFSTVSRFSHEKNKRLLKASNFDPSSKQTFLSFLHEKKARLFMIQTLFGIVIEFNPDLENEPDPIE